MQILKGFSLNCLMNIRMLQYFIFDFEGKICVSLTDRITNRRLILGLVLHEQVFVDMFAFDKRSLLV